MGIYGTGASARCGHRWVWVLALPKPCWPTREDLAGGGETGGEQVECKERCSGYIYKYIYLHIGSI